jgi:hypothetical protein
MRRVEAERGRDAKSAGVTPEEGEMTSGRPKLSISLVCVTLVLFTVALAFVNDARATGNFNP